MVAHLQPKYYKAHANEDWSDSVILPTGSGDEKDPSHIVNNNRQTVLAPPSAVSATRSLHTIIKSIPNLHLDNMRIMKASRISDDVTVVISNKSSESRLRTPSKKKAHPVTPDRRVTTKRSFHYSSPDCFKRRSPGADSFSPQNLWKNLSFSPSKKKASAKKQSRRKASGKENDWVDQWMDQVTFPCGTYEDLEGDGSFTVRLTPNTLQEHEARSLPFFFSGDKLAKTVIHEKTQHQLAKELKERAQQELEVERPMESYLATLAEDSEDDRTKEWMDLERKKALAAMWQRKKNEHWERLRAEQLRLAELERQRHLRAIELRLVEPSTPKKEPRPKICALPTTPKTHNSAKSKLIHI